MNMHCKYLIAAPNKVNYLNEVVYIGFYNTAMLLKMYNCNCLLTSFYNFGQRKGKKNIKHLQSQCFGTFWYLRPTFITHSLAHGSFNFRRNWTTLKQMHHIFYLIKILRLFLLRFYVSAFSFFIRKNPTSFWHRITNNILKVFFYNSTILRGTILTTIPIDK